MGTDAKPGAGQAARIEDRGEMQVVVFGGDKGCRPATAFEAILWHRNLAQSEALTVAEEMAEMLDHNHGWHWQLLDGCKACEVLARWKVAKESR